jgi:hypothetical protein
MSNGVLIRNLAIGAVALGAAAALSACQPNNSAATAGGTQSVHAVSGGSGGSTAGAAGGGSASTGSGGGSGQSGQGGSGGSSACAGGDLKLKTVNGGSGTGHSGIVLLFTNTGSSTCTLSGYPGAAVSDSGQENWALDPDGNAKHETQAQGANPVTTVTLAPGSTASAQLFWDTFPLNSTYGDGTQPDAANCLSYRGGYLEITPPNTTTTIKSDPPLSMCQSLEISPVVSGTTGS